MCVVHVFFFKQKTAYEMRISDWSSDVCSSDLLRHTADRARGGFTQLLNEQPLALGAMGIALGALLAASVPPTRREDELMGQKSDELKIGRASCRERVCQYV